MCFSQKTHYPNAFVEKAISLAERIINFIKSKKEGNYDK
jgi:hypothetical protein